MHKKGIILLVMCVCIGCIFSAGCSSTSSSQSAGAPASVTPASAEAAPASASAKYQSGDIISNKPYPYSGSSGKAMVFLIFDYDPVKGQYEMIADTTHGGEELCSVPSDCRNPPQMPSSSASSAEMEAYNMRVWTYERSCNPKTIARAEVETTYPYLIGHVTIGDLKNC